MLTRDCWPHTRACISTWSSQRIKDDEVWIRHFECAFGVSAKIASLIANEGMEWAVVVNRGRQDITPPEPARWGL